GQGWNRAPAHQRLVAVSEVPDMVVSVRVPGRVSPREAKFATEQLDIFRLSGQEEPSRPYPVRFDVVLQHLGRVVLRVQRDAVHEQISPNTLAEHFLHAHEVRRGGDT